MVKKKVGQYCSLWVLWKYLQPLHGQMYLSPLGSLHLKLCLIYCGIWTSLLTYQVIGLCTRIKKLERKFKQTNKQNKQNYLEEKYLRIFRMHYTKMKVSDKTSIYLQLEVYSGA